MRPLHSLLERQLKRCFGSMAAVPEEWHGFLDTVDKAYREADDDRKMLERSLELSSQELLQFNAEMQAIVQAFPDIFLLLDRDGTVLTSRGHYRRDFYLAPELLVGKKIQDIPIGDVGRRFRTALAEVADGKAMVSLDYSLNIQGAEEWYEARLVPLVRDQILVIVRNISERNRAEQQLKRSESQLAEAQRLAQLGSWNWDIPTDTVTWSDEMYRLYGMSHTGFKGTLGGALSCIHPEDRNHFLEIVMAALRNHHPFSLYHRTLAASGPERIIHVRGEIVIAESGMPRSVLGSSQDVTELKRAEGALQTARNELEIRVRERTAELLKVNEELQKEVSERMQAERALRESQEQLIQAQKMEAIGKFAGGIAHDFNNLLTVINGYSELVMYTLDQGDPRCANMNQIRQASKRAAGLTHQLLAFSRRQVLQPKVLNLNAVVRNTEEMLKRLIGEDLFLVSILQPELGLVKADPSQLDQVIMNLAVNARDAMPQGGRLTLETANVEITRSKQEDKVPAGSYIMLSVTDTGCGMDDVTKTRLFEPFFTTKARGKGTGLGLSTVYGIVKQSGGYIFVNSEVGKGTAFKMYLPRVEEKLSDMQALTADGRPKGGTETILLVEDEEALRVFARTVLRDYGYSVLESEQAEEALFFSGRYGGSIDLLLTDVIMPGSNGRQLAERVTASRPNVKVLYMSGYTDDVIAEHGVLDPGTCFLEKPFGPETLARRVREVLDSPLRQSA